MTDPSIQAGDPPGPSEDGDAVARAHELFAHGLLVVASPGEPAAREARIRRVLDALDTRAAAGWRMVLLRFRPLAAAAALLLAGLTALVFFVAAEPRAHAILRESIAAL
jgi:hypothetical protein